MIRHALVEGWVLLRHRGPMSLTLALALAVPVCLAGLSLSASAWLAPLAEIGREASVVTVLLHPQLDADQRAAWLEETAARHPEWQLEVVAPEVLRTRLLHWFPYLEGLLDEGGESLLPPMVEITTTRPDTVAELTTGPSVIAVGPRSSIGRLLAAEGRRLGLLLALVTAILLAAALLLAGVWVHLELYRHADEITIMRLVGASESAIRGPFLVAVAAPALCAGLVAVTGTMALAGLASRLAGALGLPALVVSRASLLLEGGLCCLLPLAAAAVTLARHSRLELDG